MFERKLEKKTKKGPIKKKIFKKIFFPYLRKTYKILSFLSIYDFQKFKISHIEYHLINKGIIKLNQLF